MRRPAYLPLLLFLCGCPHPPVERPYAPPQAAELLAHVATRSRAVRSMRADTKVDYLAEKGERLKVSIALLTEAPDHLHMDAEVTLAGTVASLATDGKTFALLDLRNNRFLTGEASPCNIARLIRVELDPADVLVLLAGGAPLIENPAAQEVGWDSSNDGREILTLRGADGRVETIKLSSRDRQWDVVFAELKNADGSVEWRVDNEDFAAMGALRFPKKTVIAQPRRKADARIRFRGREVDVAVPPGAFHLTPPPGLAVETVTCR